VFEEIEPGVFRVSRSTIRRGSEDEAEIIRKFGIGASELRDRSFTQEIPWPCEVISMVIESGRRMDKNHWRQIGLDGYVSHALSCVRKTGHYVISGFRSSWPSCSSWF